jgi:hypothetical protein
MAVLEVYLDIFHRSDEMHAQISSLLDILPHHLRYGFHSCL